VFDIEFFAEREVEGVSLRLRGAGERQMARLSALIFSSLSRLARAQKSGGRLFDDVADGGLGSGGHRSPQQPAPPDGDANGESLPLDALSQAGNHNETAEAKRMYLVHRRMRNVAAAAAVAANDEDGDEDDESALPALAQVERMRARTLSLGLKVDEACRVLFPLNFLIFNVLYWWYYLVYTGEIPQ